jgi:transcriptional regulator with XRE-family HTH domain
MSTKKPNSRDIEVGQRIRSRRTALGMSQKILGERLGISFQQVQKYEKGTNRITIDRLRQISEALGTSVNFFISGNAEELEPVSSIHGFGDTKQESFNIEFLDIKEGIELNQAFVRISDPKMRRRAIDFVNSLAKNEKSRKGARNGY